MPFSFPVPQYPENVKDYQEILDLGYRTFLSACSGLNLASDEHLVFMLCHGKLHKDEPSAKDVASCTVLSTHRIFQVDKSTYMSSIALDDIIAIEYKKGLTVLSKSELIFDVRPNHDPTYTAFAPSQKADKGKIVMQIPDRHVSEFFYEMILKIHAFKLETKRKPGGGAPQTTVSAYFTPPVGFTPLNISLSLSVLSSRHLAAIAIQPLLEQLTETLIFVPEDDLEMILSKCWLSFSLQVVGGVDTRDAADHSSFGRRIKWVRKLTDTALLPGVYHVKALDQQTQLVEKPFVHFKHPLCFEYIEPSPSTTLTLTVNCCVTLSTDVATKQAIDSYQDVDSTQLFGPGHTLPASGSVVLNQISSPLSEASIPLLSFLSVPFIEMTLPTHQSDEITPYSSSYTSQIIHKFIKETLENLTATDLVHKETNLIVQPSSDPNAKRHMNIFLCNLQLLQSLGQDAHSIQKSIERPYGYAPRLVHSPQSAAVVGSEDITEDKDQTAPSSEASIDNLPTPSDIFDSINNDSPQVHEQSPPTRMAAVSFSDVQLPPKQNFSRPEQPASLLGSSSTLSIPPPLVVTDKHDEPGELAYVPSSLRASDLHAAGFGSDKELDSEGTLTRSPVFLDDRHQHITSQAANVLIKPSSRRQHHRVIHSTTAEQPKTPQQPAGTVIKIPDVDDSQAPVKVVHESTSSLALVSRTVPQKPNSPALDNFLWEFQRFNSLTQKWGKPIGEHDPYPFSDVSGGTTMKSQGNIIPFNPYWKWVTQWAVATHLDLVEAVAEELETFHETKEHSTTRGNSTPVLTPSRPSQDGKDAKKKSRKPRFLQKLKSLRKGQKKQPHPDMDFTDDFATDDLPPGELLFTTPPDHHQDLEQSATDQPAFVHYLSKVLSTPKLSFRSATALLASMPNRITSPITKRTHKDAPIVAEPDPGVMSTLLEQSVIESPQNDDMFCEFKGPICDLTWQYSDGTLKPGAQKPAPNTPCNANDYTWVPVWQPGCVLRRRCWIRTQIYHGPHDVQCSCEFCRIMEHGLTEQAEKLEEYNKSAKYAVDLTDPMLLYSDHIRDLQMALFNMNVTSIMAAIYNRRQAKKKGKPSLLVDLNWPDINRKLHVIETIILHDRQYATEVLPQQHLWSHKLGGALYQQRMQQFQNVHIYQAGAQTNTATTKDKRRKPFFARNRKAELQDINDIEPLPQTPSGGNTPTQTVGFYDHVQKVFRMEWISASDWAKYHSLLAAVLRTCALSLCDYTKVISPAHIQHCVQEGLPPQDCMTWVMDLNSLKKTQERRMKAKKENDIFDLSSFTVHIDDQEDGLSLEEAQAQFARALQDSATANAHAKDIFQILDTYAVRERVLRKEILQQQHDNSLTDASGATKSRARGTTMVLSSQTSQNAAESSRTAETTRYDPILASYPPTTLISSACPFNITSDLSYPPQNSLGLSSLGISSDTTIPSPTYIVLQILTILAAAFCAPYDVMFNPVAPPIYALPTLRVYDQTVTPQGYNPKYTNPDVCQCSNALCVEARIRGLIYKHLQTHPVTEDNRRLVCSSCFKYTDSLDTPGFNGFIKKWDRQYGHFRGLLPLLVYIDNMGVIPKSWQFPTAVIRTLMYISTHHLTVASVVNRLSPPLYCVDPKAAMSVTLAYRNYQQLRDEWEHDDALASSISSFELTSFVDRGDSTSQYIYPTHMNYGVYGALYTHPMAQELPNNRQPLTNAFVHEHLHPTSITVGKLSSVYEDIITAIPSLRDVDLESPEFMRQKQASLFDAFTQLRPELVTAYDVPDYISATEPYLKRLVTSVNLGEFAELITASLSWQKNTLRQNLPLPMLLESHKINQTLLVASLESTMMRYSSAYQSLSLRLAMNLPLHADEPLSQLFFLLRKATVQVVLDELKRVCAQEVLFTNLTAIPCPQASYFLRIQNNQTVIASTGQPRPVLTLRSAVGDTQVIGSPPPAADVTSESHPYFNHPLQALLPPYLFGIEEAQTLACPPDPQVAAQPTQKQPSASSLNLLYPVLASSTLAVMRTMGLAGENVSKKYFTGDPKERADSHRKLQSYLAKPSIVPSNPARVGKFTPYTISSSVENIYSLPSAETVFAAAKKAIRSSAGKLVNHPILLAMLKSDIMTCFDAYYSYLAYLLASPHAQPMPVPTVARSIVIASLPKALRGDGMVDHNMIASHRQINTALQALATNADNTGSTTDAPAAANPPPAGGGKTSRFFNYIAAKKNDIVAVFDSDRVQLQTLPRFFEIYPWWLASHKYQLSPVLYPQQVHDIMIPSLQYRLMHQNIVTPISPYFHLATYTLGLTSALAQHALKNPQFSFALSNISKCGFVNSTYDAIHADAEVNTVELSQYAMLIQDTLRASNTRGVLVYDVIPFETSLSVLLTADRCLTLIDGFMAEIGSSIHMTTQYLTDNPVTEELYQKHSLSPHHYFSHPIAIAPLRAKGYDQYALYTTTMQTSGEVIDGTRHLFNQLIHVALRSALTVLVAGLSSSLASIGLKIGELYTQCYHHQSVFDQALGQVVERLDHELKRLNDITRASITGAQELKIDEPYDSAFGVTFVSTFISDRPANTYQQNFRGSVSLQGYTRPSFASQYAGMNRHHIDHRQQEWAQTPPAATPPKQPAAQSNDDEFDLSLFLNDDDNNKTQSPTHAETTNDGANDDFVVVDMLTVEDDDRDDPLLAYYRQLEDDYDEDYEDEDEDEDEDGAGHDNEENKAPDQADHGVIKTASSHSLVEKAASDEAQDEVFDLDSIHPTRKVSMAHRGSVYSRTTVSKNQYIHLYPVAYSLADLSLLPSDHMRAFVATLIGVDVSQELHQQPDPRQCVSLLTVLSVVHERPLIANATMTAVLFHLVQPVLSAAYGSYLPTTIKSVALPPPAVLCPVHHATLLSPHDAAHSDAVCVCPPESESGNLIAILSRIPFALRHDALLSLPLRQISADLAVVYTLLPLLQGAPDPSQLPPLLFTTNLTKNDVLDYQTTLRSALAPVVPASGPAPKLSYKDRQKQRKAEQLIRSWQRIVCPMEVLPRLGAWIYYCCRLLSLYQRLDGDFNEIDPSEEEVNMMLGQAPVLSGSLSATAAGVDSNDEILDSYLLPVSPDIIDRLTNLGESSTKNQKVSIDQSIVMHLRSHLCGLFATAKSAALTPDALQWCAILMSVDRSISFLLGSLYVSHLPANPRLSWEHY